MSQHFNLGPVFIVCVMQKFWKKICLCIDNLATQEFTIPYPRGERYKGVPPVLYVNSKR